MKAASLRFFQSGVVLIAVVFIALFFYTALPRLRYPYDLDFVEDSMLMQSLRIADGQPVYLPPNADFNPHVYMPLFFWLGAILFKIGGPSLVLLRLISFGATLATTILIYWIAFRESGLRWIAIACAGLFLGGYRINGFWYEIARVNSLFVALDARRLCIGNLCRKLQLEIDPFCYAHGVSSLHQTDGIYRCDWAIPVFIDNNKTSGLGFLTRL